MPSNGWVKVTMDRPRRLRADINALCLVEETTGKSLLVPGEFERCLMSFIGQRSLLYAFLLADDPGMTVERAGELMHNALQDGRYEEVVNALTVALKTSLPQAATATESGDVTAPLVGTTSGASPESTSRYQSLSINS